MYFRANFVAISIIKLIMVFREKVIAKGTG